MFFLGKTLSLTHKRNKKLKATSRIKLSKPIKKDLFFICFYFYLSEMLIAKILETENTPVRDLSGYAYSFVVVKLMPLHEHVDAEYKTKLVRAGFWPAFGDVFSFVIDKEELKEQILYLYQYELNRWSKQDGIGQIAFELKDTDLLKEKVSEVEFKKRLRPYDPLIGLVSGYYKLIG